VNDEVNIGIAIGLPANLVVPVIRHADKLSIKGLAAAAGELIEKARKGKLGVDDLAGGTFTVNNNGANGSWASAPIINGGQAGIVTMEAIVKKLVVRDDDSIAIRQMMTKLSALPGIAAISTVRSIPLGLMGSSSSRFEADGYVPAKDERPMTNTNVIGADYFHTVNTPMVEGREFSPTDTASSQQVAVVNQTFAHEFYPKGDAIGKHFGIGDAKHAGDYEIVGIVEDAKYQDAREPAYTTFFLPFLQQVTDKDPAYNTMILRSNYAADIELRVAGKPEKLEAAVRRTLSDINPDLTVLDVLSLQEQVSRNFNQERLIAQLTGLYGMLALVLACIGLYGVTAYSVAQRTSEIGIRMALGAARNNVLGLVLRGALMQVVIGLGVGIPAALALGRLVASELYGVKTYDPFVLGGAVAVLTACTLLAGFVPAQRAASIEPMQALRSE
jgi:predicted permease